MPAPYTDNTFTTAKQDGPTLVSFPFLNWPTKDKTCRQYTQNMVVLPGSFTPLTALSTWPGDGTFAANANIYLVEETDPTLDAGAYRFQRRYSSIPATQNVYSSLLIVRPSLHDFMVDVSGTKHFGVSFDEGLTSHRFNTRVSVSRVGAITAAQVKKSLAAEAVTDFSAGTFSLTSTTGATYSPSFTSSAASIWSTLSASAATGLTVTKGIGTITISWTGGVRNIGTTQAGVRIEGSVGSGTVTFRVGTGAVTDAETEIVSPPTRVLTTGAAHSGAAGEWMAAWNNDKLVGIIKPTAASGTSVTIDCSESPWNINGLAITHLAFAGQAAARYVNGPVAVTTKEVHQFYLPGVSPGITTPEDIPLVAPQTDPASWMTLIINGTSLGVVQGSQLQAWQGPIYEQTTIYAQMSDAIDTVNVSA